MIKFVKSSLVLKNTRKKSISVLGGIPIRPGTEVDVFQARELSEATVLDALRMPDGELYKEIVEKQNLKLVDFNLVLSANAKVDFDNITAVNTGVPGQVLGLDDSGKLAWKWVVGSGHVDVAHPLIRNGETLTIEKAGAQSNGYLSKEDWLMFKGRTNGFKIWQYQDFNGPVGTSLKITTFQNGKNCKFVPEWIVDGSVVVVDKKTGRPLKPADSKFSLFGKKEVVTVEQHIGESVVLDKAPDGKAAARAYFLVALPATEGLPEAYEQAPKHVRDARVEFIDSLDIDYGGDKNIKGRKTFEDEVAFKEDVRIGTQYNSYSELQVHGTVIADSLQIKNNPQNHMVLTSNSIGNATWAPPISTSYSPPSGPYSGQMWVNSNDYDVMVYDSNRCCWLSTTHSMQITAGLPDTFVSHSYLRTGDGISTAQSGVVLPYSAKLVSLTVSSDTSGTWSGEVHLNGQFVYGAAVHLNGMSSATSEFMNVDFSAGSRIQLYVNGIGASLPRITAVFRKRY